MSAHKQYSLGFHGWIASVADVCCDESGAHCRRSKPSSHESRLCCAVQTLRYLSNRDVADGAANKIATMRMLPSNDRQRLQAVSSQRLCAREQPGLLSQTSLSSSAVKLSRLRSFKAASRCTMNTDGIDLMPACGPCTHDARHLARR